MFIESIFNDANLLQYISDTLFILKKKNVQETYQTDKLSLHTMNTKNSRYNHLKTNKKCI